MFRSDLKQFEKRLKDYGSEMTSSKEKSEEFLHKIGVTTSKGNISKNYRGLCTRPERG